MPFMKQLPKPFTSDRLLQIKPGLIGCYGLLTDGRWIYIGQGDVRERLLEHLNGDNACITRNAPTHWLAELTDAPESTERQLIREYNPICNLRVG